MPIQIIVTKQLDPEKNLWLRSLTNQLPGKQEVDVLLDEYSAHQNQELYDSVMDIIMKANGERFGGQNMCKTMEELLEPRIREREAISEARGKAYGKAEGKAEQIVEMGSEFGLSREDILVRLQNKLNLPLQKAEEYMKMFSHCL